MTEPTPQVDRVARMWAIIGAVVVVVCLVILLVGCSDTETPRQDLDENDVDYVATPWTVYGNYDQFPNVAVRCDGSTRMYTTTRASDSLEIVPDHELCQGGDS
jgi:hypothetical protein